MKNSLKSGSLLLAAMVIIAGWHIQSEKVVYTVSAESKIWVEGTSTLHDWTCEATEISGAVDLVLDGDAAPTIAMAQISVPTATMDCHNGTMDGKLKKALKSDDSPNLLFELGSASVPSPATADSFEVATEGYMMIAGQTREIELSQYMTERDDGKVVFRGSFPISMKDFKVKPPSALLGTIKTGNDVVVFYELVLEMGDSSS